MTKILVATDFSTSSQSALNFAIGLANKTEGSIMLIWVANQISENELNTKKSIHFFAETHEALQNMVKKVRERLTSKTCDYRIRCGHVDEEVANQAKYTDVDYVICGSYGLRKDIKGNLEKNAGSNAFKIASNTHCCPVITVPKDYKNQDGAKKILLPIDSSEDTRQKLEYAISYAKIYNSSIEVLGLFSTSLSSLRRKVEQYVNQMVSLIKENNIEETHAYVECDSISKATLAFSEKNNIDLIVTMKEQEIATKNIFLGTYAKQIINQSPIPVMSISSKEVSSTKISFGIGGSYE